jgi:hypothetical protein
MRDFNKCRIFQYQRFWNMRDFKISMALQNAGFLNLRYFEKCGIFECEWICDIEGEWERRNMTDQGILGELIYRKHQRRLLTHDSCFCFKYKESVPFPTQREDNRTFVGLQYVHGNSPVPMPDLNPCPVVCRPLYGRNWTFC